MNLAPATVAAPARKRFLACLLTLAAAAGCGKLADDLACADEGCEFTSDEWARIRSLSELGEPPPDPSNKYLPQSAFAAPADPGQAARELAVVRLGQRYYFETRFSGNAIWKDVVGRDTTGARAARGEPIKAACATCHDPIRGGGDVTSANYASGDGHVGVGAGWYDVNGQQTLNAAQFPLLYWNGRSDSLWSQAAAVMESPVSMNGNRLAIVWTVADNYRADHEAIFTDAPLPMTGTSAEVKMLLAKDAAGKDLPTCAGTAPDACPAGCRAVKNEVTGADLCFPRFPLAGKPGAVTGCQAGDPGEPFGDAYDCMAPEDRPLLDRAYSHIVKAIAAYEWKLTSRNSAFDAFARHDASVPPLSPAAQRGLKLFVGRASCVDCHNGPLLSDGGFHNIGVPQAGAGVPTVADCGRGNARCDCVTEGSTTCWPWGVASGLATLRTRKAFRRDGPYSDNPELAGAPYARFYDLNADLAPRRGAWRTPSLRDVARTAPYMHNGFFRTLDEVVWHYDQGGSSSGVGEKAPELQPLLLSARDRADLVEFLRSLDGAPAQTDFLTAAQP